MDRKLPLLARKPTGLLGVTSEEFSDALSSYVHDNPDGLLRPEVRLDLRVHGAGFGALEILHKV